MLIGKFNLICPKCEGEDFRVEKKRRKPVDKDGNILPSNKAIAFGDGTRLLLCEIQPGESIPTRARIFTSYYCKSCDKLIAKHDSRKNLIHVIRFDGRTLSTQYDRFNIAIGKKVEKWTHGNMVSTAAKEEIIEKIQDMLAFSQKDYFIIRFIVRHHQCNEVSARAFIAKARQRSLKARASQAGVSPEQKHDDELAAACAHFEAVIRKCAEVLSHGPSQDALRISMQARVELCKLQGLYAEHYGKVAAAANAGKTLIQAVQIIIPDNGRVREMPSQILRVLPNGDGKPDVGQ